MAENTNSRKERRADSRVLKRRRRNVLLIMGELARCLVLGIGAVVCQRTVNRMQAEELGPDFYTEAINQKTVEPATSMSKSIEEVTNESGDVIDPAVGIVMNKRLGDRVQKGDRLATLYARTKESAANAARAVKDALTITHEAAQPPKLIYAVITREGTRIL